VHGEQITGRHYDAYSMNAELSTGFLRAADPGVLILRGDDAGEFLNGQVSNDVSALVDGESKYALLLTPKGKLRADMTIAKDGDETVVVTTTEHLPAIRQTIETYRIGYFFSTEDATGEWSLVRIVGDFDTSDLAFPVVELTSPLGVDLLVESAELDALTAELGAKGVAELSEEEFAAARISRAVPEFGAELDAETFPAEAGLEARAVSFEKGCYVGQETVARMHYKGKPNRHLRILSADGPIVSGAAVTAKDGRELGRVGTTATNLDGKSTALAILRREGETGDVVDVGGVPATIVQIEASAGR
jgi:folate-binding protein YgfZ